MDVATVQVIIGDESTCAFEGFKQLYVRKSQVGEK